MRLLKIDIRIQLAVFIVFMLFLFFCGIGNAFRTYDLIQQCRSFHKWKRTKAVLTSVHWRRPFRSRGRRAGAKRPQKLLSIRYEYEVDGVKYEGNKIELNGYDETRYDSSSPGFKNYKGKGREITIRYNPENPKQAAVRNRKPAHWFMVYVSIVFSLIFGFLAMVGLIRLKYLHYG